MQNLYGWLFTYNPFTENWRATKQADGFFSKPESSFLTSSKIQTLVEIIRRTNGDKKLINKLLNNGT